ncbi:sugar ABC transporter substrate-binding protein [Chloroflexi bacterium TSY]|nr:sugar ABC transporter substrate-binding protein [Chloroflexi bacterium TSY]
MNESISRRAFLQMSAAIAAGSALAACAPAAGPGAGSGASQAATQIVFWPRGSSDEEVFTKMLPMVQEQYPEIEVVFETPPEKIYEKLAVAIAGGTAPDSTVINTPWGVPMIGQGAFLSLQDFIDADATVKESYEQHFAPPAVAAYTFENQAYTVPITSESIVFWYNVDAMEEAGLTPPREIENDPEQWNWNTLVEYAGVLNEGEGRDRARFGIICSGPRSDYGLQIGFGNFIYANGGQFLNEDGNECVLNSPENEAAIKFVRDFIYEQDVHPEITSLMEWQNPRVSFLSQQVGMMVEGEFLRRYLWGTRAPSDGISFNYDLAKMPFIDGQRAMVYHCLGAPILKDSSHAEEAWKWLQVISSQEAQQLITDFWGSRGADARTYESWLASSGGGPEGINIAAITDSDEFGIPFPVSPFLESAALLEPMTRILYDLVLQNQMDIVEGLAQVEEETNGRLQKSMEEMGVL